MTVSQSNQPSAVKPETIGSILDDIQGTTNDLFKAAQRLDSHADSLLGSKPADESKAKDEAAAHTVIQRLRDLRRQLKTVNENLYDTGSRLEGQF